MKYETYRQNMCSNQCFTAWPACPGITELSLKQHRGRDNTGQIATRFRGGGHKRRYRIVDFERPHILEQEVRTTPC